MAEVQQKAMARGSSLTPKGSDRRFSIVQREIEATAQESSFMNLATRSTTNTYDAFKRKNH